MLGLAGTGAGVFSKVRDFTVIPLQKKKKKNIDVRILLIILLFHFSSDRECERAALVGTVVRNEAKSFQSCDHFRLQRSITKHRLL